jgi:hypothetical protein
MTQADLLSGPLACLCPDLMLPLAVPTVTGATRISYGIYWQRLSQVGWPGWRPSAFLAWVRPPSWPATRPRGQPLAVAG